jgi:hypothetical protein
MRTLVVTVMALTNFAASTLAQEVSIADPGLNAAIREALEKPSGPVPKSWRANRSVSNNWDR